MRPGSSLLADFYFCLGFFTRLPFPFAACGGEPRSLETFPRAVRMLPVAGGLVGALAAIAMAAAYRSGFPPPLAAAVAICALVLLGGAMHEDGLADCADGFSGGTTRERKLEIMADSRIGTFGAVALVLSLYLRAASLAIIADESVSSRWRGADRSGSFVPRGFAHALGPPSARARKRSRFCRGQAGTSGARRRCLPRRCFCPRSGCGGRVSSPRPRGHCRVGRRGLCHRAARSKTNRGPDRGCRGRRAAT